MASPHTGFSYTRHGLVSASASNNPSAASTPPPPPPKTGYAHTSSLAGPPLPPHPDQQVVQNIPEKSHYRYSQAVPAAYREQSFPQKPSSNHEQARDSHSPQVVDSQARVQLPLEGWLPPSLADKSKQRLQDLLSTPALFAAIVHAPETAHPSLNASTHPIRQLVDINVAFANELVSLEATLASRRDHVQGHLLSVRALEQQWRKKQAELETRLEAFGPRVLHQRLAQGINEQDAVCHGLEESFLESQGLASEREVGEWIRGVRDARKIANLRRERKARWDEGRVGGWR